MQRQAGPEAFRPHEAEALRLPGLREVSDEVPLRMTEVPTKLKKFVKVDEFGFYWIDSRALFEEQNSQLKEILDFLRTKNAERAKRLVGPA
jgi:hypothetical protein